MALDPSIILGIKPAQIESPVNQLANVIAIQNAQSQNALAKYKLSQAEREDADISAYRRTVDGADIATPEGLSTVRNALVRMGKVKEAQELGKGALDARNIESQISERDLKAAQSRLEAWGAELAPLVARINQGGSITHDDVFNAGARLERLGAAPPNWREGVPMNAMQLPQFVRDMALVHEKGRKAVEAMLPSPEKIDNNSSISFVNKNPLAGGIGLPIEGAPTILKTAAPEAPSVVANRKLIPDGKGGFVANQPLIDAESKIAGAGASKQTTLVNTFTPASEEAQKEFMKSSRVNYERLRDVPQQLANLDKAKGLIGASSPFVGSFGDTKLALVQFLNNNIGTNIKATEVANAGELRTRVFQNIMDNLKKMDAQPSQLQQQIMMDALGNLNTDPGAMRQMLDAYADVLRDKVAIHNREVSGAERRGVKFPYNPIVDLRTSEGGQDRVIDFNNLPKK